MCDVVRWNSVMLIFMIFRDCDEVRDVDFVEMMWICVIFELLGQGLGSSS